MDFTKYQCPVCQEIFKDEDDVVVCPECGTPHHRECWFKDGKCFNHNLHGKEEIKPVPVVEEEKKEEENKAPTFDSLLPEELINKTFRINQVDENGNILHEDVNPDDIMMEDVPLSYVHAAVGKNQPFYMAAFSMLQKSTKGIVWNVAGFFVPLAWSFYRKMYKLFGIILALYVLAIGVTGYGILSNEEFVKANEVCMQEDTQYAVKILTYASGSEGVTLTASPSELYDIMTKLEPPLYVTIINYAVTIGLRIFVGLFGTKFYKKKIMASVRKYAALNLPKGRTKLRLHRKCGVNSIILAFIIGFIEFQFFGL